MYFMYVFDVYNSLLLDYGYLPSIDENRHGGMYEKKNVINLIK